MSRSPFTPTAGRIFPQNPATLHPFTSPLTPMTSTPQSSMARKFSAKSDHSLRKSQLLQRCLDSARKSRQSKFAKFRSISTSSAGPTAGFIPGHTAQAHMSATAMNAKSKEARDIIRRQVSECMLGLSEEELVTLEAAVCRELVEEEERLLRQYEEMERLEVCAQKASVEQFREDESAVLCPICASGSVRLAKGVFSCQCGFRLDAVNEAITLQQFKQALAKAHAGHASAGKGCMATPKFAVQSNYGGVPLLVLQCSACHYFQFV